MAWTTSYEMLFNILGDVILRSQSSIPSQKSKSFFHGRRHDTLIVTLVSLSHMCPCQNVALVE